MRSGAGIAVPGGYGRREFVPNWLALYVFLGMGDLAFTLIAFQIGAIELNPFLRSLQSSGLFEFMKLSLTLLILCVAYQLRERPLIQRVMVVANCFMIVLNVYHVSSLSVIFSG